MAKTKMREEFRHRFRAELSVTSPDKEERFWRAFEEVLRTPETFLHALEGCSVSEAAGDLQETVFERKLDFGPAVVHDIVRIDRQRGKAVIYVPSGQEFPESILEMKLLSFTDEAIEMEFVYELEETAERHPAPIIELVHRAWVDKDRNMLDAVIERIL